MKQINLLVTICLGFLFTCACQSTLDSKKQVLIKRDTFHFPLTSTNNSSLGDSSKPIPFLLNEIKGFCLRNDYKVSSVETITLISNQEEFETIIMENCGNYKTLPLIDFSKNKIAAVIIDNKIQEMDGLREIHLSFKIDSSYRRPDQIFIKYTISKRSESTRPIRQLFLYQIPIDEKLNRVQFYNSNGFSGAILVINRNNEHLYY